ncbi:MAG: metallophosphoesterase, partial [Actinomycetota bacterium]
DVSAQIGWRHLPAGRLDVVVHHQSGSVTHDLGDPGGAGVADIDGFTPNTATPIEIVVDGRVIADHVVQSQPTIDDGAVTRIATISDLHLGETGFGLVKQLREPDDVTPYPLRCALAAVREAQAWGAELLVIKGDITEEGLPHEWELFDQLLDQVSIPVVAVPGNHDTVEHNESADATRELQQRGLFPEPVHVLDRTDTRIVLADSTVPTHSWGRLGRHRELLLDAVAVDRPALIFTHHHLEDRMVPWFWPLGVQRYDNASLVRELAEANPDLFISSGHTHRTRARTEAGVAITEVGSTKDFPGVWAGYTVHGSGVRQVVRRVAQPDCVSWTERTHAVVAGIWGRWSPGTLADRSLTHRWPSGRPPTPHQASSEPASERV